ncbi:MAG: DUF4287 domain-containing protein [Chloroflexi bacterium]|nr:DUF4287 domain-containing protein [Chloroflexota bacterium]
MKDQFDKINNVGTAAVRAKTGKGWAEWIALLDQAGAKKMTHPEIVAYLRAQHQVGAWWQQMVTVGYEQARHKRAQHQMPDGYQISVSKTLNVPVAKLFAAWQARAPRDLAVSKTTARKSVRGAWKNGASRVDVAFYAKGELKSQIVIQHNKLANARAAAQMKIAWTKMLVQIADALSAPQKSRSAQ